MYVSISKKALYIKGVFPWTNLTNLLLHIVLPPHESYIEIYHLNGLHDKKGSGY